MDELIERTGKDELASAVQELNDLTKKDFEELINEKIELDKDFKIDSITEEDKKKLSKEDLANFEIGVKLFEDKDKAIDPFDIIPDFMLDDTDKLAIEKAKNGEMSPEEYDGFKDTLRQQYILLAMDIYNQINQEKFSKEVEKINKETIPEEVVMYFFNESDKAYNLDSEKMTVSYSADDFEQRIRNEGYAESIILNKMIELSKDNLFLSRLRKQSKPDRYNRHVDNLNYIFMKKLKTNERSATTTVTNLDYTIRKTFFKRFKLDIHNIEKETNGAISKAYVIAMDTLYGKRSNDNRFEFVELYYHNINPVMLSNAINPENLTGSAKKCYERILEFIGNIYTYFKYDEK